MMEIVWKDTYSVGVEEIDRQHQDFIKLIRRIQIIHEKGDPKDLMVRIIEELGAYAKYHFVSEENIMYLIRYPDLPRQESEHRKLIEAFQKKVKGYEEDEISLDGLIQFLLNWFVEHTTEEDKKISRYIEQMSIKK
jgi:hemerythrin